MQDPQLKEHQVKVVEQQDFEDCQEAWSVLRSANPHDEQFRSPDDWWSRGVRVVLLSRKGSVGVDGLQFIDHLVLWSPPRGSLRQLYGRFWRVADRQDVTSGCRQNDAMFMAMHSCILVRPSAAFTGVNAPVLFYVVCFNTELKPVYAWHQTQATFGICRGGSQQLSVWAITIDQYSGPLSATVVSRERALLTRGELASKLADAIADGTHDFQPDSDSSIFMDLCIASRATRQPTLLQLPPYQPRQRRHSQLGGSVTTEQQRQTDASFNPGPSNPNLLGSLLPNSDPETDAAKRTPKTLNRALAQELMHAAHQLLNADTYIVLDGMLSSMPNLLLAPYMLAMVERSRQIQVDKGDMYHSDYKLASIDIEKATTRRSIETWPHYADHAADGMSPVIPVLEFGYAKRTPTGILSAAIQAQETLDKEREATTGMCGSMPSRQYRSDNKAIKVNTTTFRNVTSLTRVRKPRVEATAIAALHSCLHGAGGRVILSHNLSGFDERACLKVMLMSEAKLHEGRDRLPSSLQETMWAATEQLLESSTLPALYQGFKPLRLLLNVLWRLLHRRTEHRNLMSRAKAADITQLPGSLEWVYVVMFLSSLLGPWQSTSALHHPMSKLLQACGSVLLQCLHAILTKG